MSRLQEVAEPLNRLRVIVEGNFDDEIFTPANAFVWISYVPRVPSNPLFARLQRVIERRSYSNLIVECRKLFAADDCPPNVSRYVNGYRIREACRTLEGGASVTDAMLASGFNTKSNFNREFLRVTGRTPSIWRDTVVGE